MSMIGMWQGWWDKEGPYPLGEITTMQLAAEWLDEVCDSVEDWGCGRADAKQFFKRASYRGVDGSGPKADVIADLRWYLSRVDGILLRHVLEHNTNWQQVLQNALSSAQKRVAIILFTPMSYAGTKQIAWGAMRPDGSVGVPDLSLAARDMFEVIGPQWSVRETWLKTETVYGGETTLYLERR